jgi:hypothetical protein
MPIGLLIGAGDVRRQRNMAQSFNVCGNDLLGSAVKTNGSLTEFATGYNFTFELSGAEDYALAYLHLSSWPDQSFPEILFNLSREKNFHPSAQMLLHDFSRRRLGMDSLSSPEQTSRQDPSIVKHQELVAR